MTSTQTGWPVGFWWAELTHPYRAFTEAGYEATVASPDGGELRADRGLVAFAGGRGRQVVLVAHDRP